MILTGHRALRAWQSAKKNPFLPLLPSSLSELIAEVIRNHFRDLPMRSIPCWFITTQSLAFITPEDPAIFIHPVLNHPDIPEQAFRYIATHELLHLTISARRIGRKLVHHPPEFWERERSLFPDEKVFWRWLYGNYSSVLKSNKKRECITVNRWWRDTHRRALRSWEEAVPVYGHVQEV